MSQIESSTKIIVHQNIQKCFEYTCDPNNTPKWYSNVREAYGPSYHEISVGTTVKLVTEIMGQEHDFEYKILTLEPHSQLIMASDNGPFPMSSEYQFKKIDENTTEITIINKAEPKGIPFFLVGMVKSKVQATMDNDVKVLQSLLQNL